MTKFDLEQMKTELIELFVNNSFEALKQRCESLNGKQVQVTLIDELDNEVVTGTLSNLKLEPLLIDGSYDESYILFSVRYMKDGKKGSDILDNSLVKEMLI